MYMLGSARPPNRPTVVVPVSRALVPPRTRVLHLREPLAFSIASARDGGRYVIAARVGADYQRDGARRSSVIYIQKSRARTSIVFFVWLMYATPDNCDKTGSRRRPAHVDGRRDRRARLAVRSPARADYSTRRRGSFLHFPPQCERAKLVTVLASARGIRFVDSLFPGLSIDPFLPPSRIGRIILEEVYS